MGAETQNQQLAGNSAARARMAESLRAGRRGDNTAMQRAAEGRARRRSALSDGGAPEASGVAEELAARMQEEAGPEVGQASMFPNEAPGTADTPKPLGYEEAVYRRGELTRERSRTGRREDLYRQFEQAAGERGNTAEVAPGGAVERGVGIFGTPFGGAGQPRSGIAFGPGRANRMPDQNTPEYAALVERMRSMGRL